MLRTIFVIREEEKKQLRIQTGINYQLFQLKFEELLISSECQGLVEWLDEGEDIQFVDYWTSLYNIQWYSPNSNCYFY